MELLGFKSRHVQGLYNFHHMERDDGAWLQIPLPFGRDKYIVYCAGPTAPIKKLHWSVPSDEIGQWELMLSSMTNRSK